MYHEVWDEISYSFPNFNGAAFEVEVWEWISNFIPLLIGYVILIHAELKLNHVNKMAPGSRNLLSKITRIRFSYIVNTIADDDILATQGAWSLVVVVCT